MNVHIKPAKGVELDAATAERIAQDIATRADAHGASYLVGRTTAELDGMRYTGQLLTSSEGQDITYTITKAVRVQ